MWLAEAFIASAAMVVFVVVPGSVIYVPVVDAAIDVDAVDAAAAMDAVAPTAVYAALLLFLSKESHITIISNINYKQIKKRKE